MKCRRCGKRAVTFLKPYRLALCSECYLQFYLRILKKSIDRHKILEKDERILAALSGGKDSVAMVSALKELGYDLEVLHINLGIGKYSEISEDVSVRLCKELDLNVHVVRLEEFGFTISKVRENSKRKTCSACGIAKRYIMNRFARENGFDVVATGHTSEDVASFYLKNVAGGSRVWAEKLMPRNEPFDPKIVARAKPLFEMSEKENMLYVLLKGLPYVEEECPYAPKPEWKEIVYEIERRKPGFSKNFVRGLVTEKKEFGEIKYCERCGEVANSSICSFCRLRERFGR